MKNWVLKLHHQSREKKKMKHVWSSVVHPGSVREEDDRTVWSRRSRRLRGCKPRTFCHLAQQPWQEVSLQTWWSHSYRKHVAAAPPPPPPPPPSAQLTHTLLFLPAGTSEGWQSWFTLLRWAHHRQKQQSAVFLWVSPLSENWIGIRPLRKWWVLSCSHLQEDNSVQMCTVGDLQRNRRPGLEQHFTTLLGFISKYRYHRKHLLENTITCLLFIMSASVIIPFKPSACGSSISL